MMYVSVAYAGFQFGSISVHRGVVNIKPCLPCRSCGQSITPPCLHINTCTYINANMLGNLSPQAGLGIFIGWDFIDRIMYKIHIKLYHLPRDDKILSDYREMYQVPQKQKCFENSKNIKNQMNQLKHAYSCKDPN